MGRSTKAPIGTRDWGSRLGSRGVSRQPIILATLMAAAVAYDLHRISEHATFF